MRASWLSTTRSRGYCCDDRRSEASAAVVVAVRLLHQRAEEVDAAERTDRASSAFCNERLGRVGLAFLDQRARDVEPAVGVSGLRLASPA